VRDGRRRLRAGVQAAICAAVAGAAAVSATVALATAGPGSGTVRTAARHSAPAVGAAPMNISAYSQLLALIGQPQAGSAIAEAATARARLGETEAMAAQQAGVVLPPGGVLLPATAVSQAARGSALAGAQLPPVGTLYAADLLVIAPQTLPADTVSAIAGMIGVTAVNQLDAARLDVNGTQVATLGVDPATFRQFAASPTATSTALWQNVADGDIVVSYLMGQQLGMPLGGPISVAGAHTQTLLVGGFGTVGISGVDAVVSESVASSLGLPSGNALVVSAPQARLSELISAITSALPAGASVAPLVGQAAETGEPVTSGSAGGIGITAADGPGLSTAQTRAFLAAAVSRVGMEYVWGGAGPTVFDCSGLVQWSMRQAGISMPRVAAEQALTGPSVPVADLQPGDLLFYHTDPTAPDYISHVAIYLGEGLMVQAPEPGKTVEVVPADFGPEFAGAVQVYPRVATGLAG
jgi:peptidoglycan DL-endopeptidase CwlO